MKQLQCIETKEDYTEAMNNINQLMQLDPIIGSDELRELRYWHALVSEYESRRCSLGFPNFVEAVKIRINELGLDDEQIASLFDYNYQKQNDFFDHKYNPNLSMATHICEMLELPVGIIYNTQ